MENTPPSTKKYFQQPVGEGANFFDDIPAPVVMKSDVSDENNSDAVLDEVSERMSENSNVGLVGKNISELNSSLSIKGEDGGIDKSTSAEEPVVCRIFSSLQNETSTTLEVKSQQGNNFFDLLGAPVVSNDMQVPFSLDDKRMSYLINENFSGPIIGRPIGIILFILIIILFNLRSVG